MEGIIRRKFAVIDRPSSITKNILVNKKHFSKYGTVESANVIMDEAKALGLLND